MIYSMMSWFVLVFSNAIFHDFMVFVDFSNSVFHDILISVDFSNDVFHDVMVFVDFSNDKFLYVMIFVDFCNDVLCVVMVCLNFRYGRTATNDGPNRSKLPGNTQDMLRRQWYVRVLLINSHHFYYPLLLGGRWFTSQQWVRF